RRAMANPLVRIIMGSKTDLEVLNGAVEILKEFGIEHEVRVLSAHRTPEQVLEWSSSAESRGLEVLIAGAGGPAHLPGAVAAPIASPSAVGSIVARERPPRASSSLDLRSAARPSSPPGRWISPKPNALSARTAPPSRRWSAAQAR